MQHTDISSTRIPGTGRRARRLFYKWVKDFIQPVMEDEDRCWHYECVMMKKVCYDPLEKPMDIRYAADGLYINDMRIN